MAPYFQRMKLVSGSWLRPQTMLDQTTTATLGASNLNNSVMVVNSSPCDVVPTS